MCVPATCRSCGKATWSGCGNHAEQVLAAVPAHDRCDCAGSSAAGVATSGLRGLSAITGAVKAKFLAR